MSALEVVAIPVLTPFLHKSLDPRTLDVLDQATICAWVTLRSMVFDSLLPANERYYTQAEREAFKNDPHLAPAGTTHIWLAPHIGKPNDARLQVTNQNKDPEGTVIHMTNFFIDQITFQLLTWRAGDWIHSEHIDRAPHWRVTRRIWPSPGIALAWPPEYYLGAKDWEAFAARIIPSAVFPR